MSDVEGEVKNLGWEEAGRQSAVGSELSGVWRLGFWDFARSWSGTGILNKTSSLRVPPLGLGLGLGLGLTQVYDMHASSFWDRPEGIPIQRVLRLLRNA
jgi:hypothetical protein